MAYVCILKEVNMIIAKLGLLLFDYQSEYFPLYLNWIDSEENITIKYHTSMDVT